jgi:hypothetical protein
MTDYDGTAHDYETTADRLTPRDVELRVAYRNVRDAYSALDDVLEDDDLLDFLSWDERAQVGALRDLLGAVRGNLARAGGSSRR